MANANALAADIEALQGILKSLHIDLNSKERDLQQICKHKKCSYVAAREKSSAFRICDCCHRVLMESRDRNV